MDHYFRDMRNITIALPDDIARWVRIRAAENDRSVSKWLAAVLEGMRQREDAYDAAMERFFARAPRRLTWVEGRTPTRDELHDRTGLR